MFYTRKKIFSYWLSIGFCLLLNGYLFAQNNQFSFDHTPLPVVFTALEKSTGHTFSYDYDLISPILISGDFKKTSIDQLVNRLLTNTGLTYNAVGRHLIIKPNNPIDPIELKKTAAICGYVKSDQQPLAFSNIILKINGRGSQSDEDGKFEIPGPFVKNTVVEISHLGYRSQQILLSEFLENDCLTIHLSSVENTLGEIIVSDQNKISSNDLFEQTISFRPSQQLAVAGVPDGDVFKSLQQIPGISGTGETATGIHIRGGTADQNLILWDNIPVYHTGHFFGMVSNFNPGLVDKVSVQKNGADSNYGNSVSGIIDLKTTNQIPDRISGEVGTNLLYGDASFKIPLFNKKAMLLFGGRRSYTDFFKNKSYDKFLNQIFQSGRVNEDPERLTDRTPLVPNTRFYDINFKFLYQLTPKDQISFSYLNTKDQTNYQQYLYWSDEIITEDRLTFSNQGYNIHFQHQWHSDHQTKISFSETKFSSDYYYISDNSRDFVQVEQDYRNQIGEKTLKINDQWQINPAHRFAYGYQYSHRNFRIFSDEDWFGELINYDFRGSRTTQSAFLNYVFQEQEKYRVKLGLRYNYHQPLNGHYFEPEFRTSFSPFAGLSISIGAGRAYQFVNQLIVDNDDFQGEEFFWTLATTADTLRGEVLRNDQIDFGIKYQKKGWTVQTDFFKKSLTGVTSFNEFSDRYYNPNITGKQSINGVEFSIAKQIKNLNLQLNYQWQQNEYDFDFWNEGKSFVPRHFQENRLQILSTYQNDCWLLSTNWTIANGLQYTPATTLKFDSPNGIPYVGLASRNSAQLPTYHRLDISGLYKWKIHKTKEWKLHTGLSLINVYNHTNFVNRFHTVQDPFNNPELLTQDKLGLPFIPNLIIKFKW